MIRTAAELSCARMAEIIARMCSCGTEPSKVSRSLCRTVLPAKATAWSSRLRASRMLPSLARANEARLRSSTPMPSWAAT